MAHPRFPRLCHWAVPGLLVALAPAAAGPAMAPARLVAIEPWLARDIPRGPERQLVLSCPASLERVPGDYRAVQAGVTAAGLAEVRLGCIGIPAEEVWGKSVALGPGARSHVSCELRAPGGADWSLIREIRILVRGGPVRVDSLAVSVAEEPLPAPEVLVGAPYTGDAIQRALDSLGPAGGVVRLEPGVYRVDKTVRIYRDNVTLYGSGPDTVLDFPQIGAMAGVLQANDRANLRISRLHLRGPEMTLFRSYNQPHLAEPGDIGRPTVTSFGIGIFRCRSVRIDHCEIERFGHSGIQISARDCLVDHCYLHENFLCGFGYGVLANGDATDVTVEDCSFENQRHGTAVAPGGAYIVRRCRFTRDAALLHEWRQSPKAPSNFHLHQIDSHPLCKHIVAHDNYITMHSGRMASGISIRGDGGAWVYGNVIENASAALETGKHPEQVCFWANRLVDVGEMVKDSAGIQILSAPPPGFKAGVYPHPLTRAGWWPGASGGR